MLNPYSISSDLPNRPEMLRADRAMSNKWKLNRRAIHIFKVLVSLALFALMARMVDPAVLLDRARATSPIVFGLGVIGIVLQMPMIALRWRLIVAAMSRLGDDLPRFGKFFQISYVAVFFSQVLPFVAGDGMRVLMLHEAGPSLRTAFKSTLLDRGLAALTLFTIALPTMLLSPILASAQAYLWPMIVLIVCGLLGAGALIASANVLHRIGQRWRVIGAMTETLVDLRSIALSRSSGPSVIGLCLLVHGISVFVFWLLAQGQGLPFYVADALAIVPCLLLVSMIPIAVGGWGVREGVAIALLSAGGVRPEEALLLSLSFGTVVLLASLRGLLLFATSAWGSASRNEEAPEKAPC
jgi:uncharacterized protein (TIRG00374 family)